MCVCVCVCVCVCAPKHVYVRACVLGAGCKGIGMTFQDIVGLLIRYTATTLSVDWFQDRIYGLFMLRITFYSNTLQRHGQ